MCYTAFIVKKQENKDFDKILKRELEKKQWENSDGFASLKLSKNFEVKEYIRSVDYLPASKMLESFNYYNLFHFRLATAGKKDNQNVHLWKARNWIFSHNGSVMQFSDDIFSDSYLFFRLLCKNLPKDNRKLNDKHVAKALEKWINKTDLYGRGFLLNLKHKKLYIFGNIEVYNYDNYFILSSSKLDFQKKIKRFGTEFYLNYEILKKEIRGYYVYNLNTNTLKKLKDTSSDYTSYYEYYQNKHLF